MSDITREDAVKWLTNLREDCGRYQDLWHYGEALEQIIKLLDTDVAPVRHGRWYQGAIFYGEDGSPCIVDICTECGAYGDYADFNYCPNCGTRMDGGGEE